MGWVGKDTVKHRLVYLTLYLVEISTLVKLLLLGIGQSIEADILQGTTSTGRGKSISHRTLRRNLTPLSRGKLVASIHRHTALIELLAISQDILTDFTQVDIEVASIVTGIGLLIGIEKWVEHPELDIFHIGLLEVVGIQLAHHTTPMTHRIRQSTIRLKVIDIEVVRTTLIRIVSNIHRIDGTTLPRISLSLSKWKKLAHIDGTHVVVAQLVEVTLDMTRSERASLAIEQGVDGIPRHLTAVESTCQSRFIFVLREHRWHTGKYPGCRGHHVYRCRGVLEVVQIGSIVLRTTGLPGYQLRKFSRKGDLGWLGKMQEWYLVQHIGQPLTLLLPVEVDTPKCIFERFLSHSDLGKQRLLTQMLEGTAHLEILGEVILPVQTEHGFTHHTEIGVAFERHIDRSTCI